MSKQRTYESNFALMLVHIRCRVRSSALKNTAGQ